MVENDDLIRKDERLITCEEVLCDVIVINDGSFFWLLVLAKSQRTLAPLFIKLGLMVLASPLVGESILKIFRDLLVLLN